MENNTDTKTCGDCGGKCGKWGRMRHYRHRGMRCGLWVIGWLFTIGFLHLTFGQGVLAIVLWPYYLGMAFGA